MIAQIVFIKIVLVEVASQNAVMYQPNSRALYE